MENNGRGLMDMIGEVQEIKPFTKQEFIDACSAQNQGMLQLPPMGVNMIDAWTKALAKAFIEMNATVTPKFWII